MKKFILFITFSFLSFAASAIPQPSHVLGGVGASTHQYTEKTQAKVDEVLEQVPNAGMRAINLEIGLYWPTYKFFSIHGATAKYSSGSPVYSVLKPQKQISIAEYSVSYSAMHFLSQEIGTGLFFRGDIGAAFRGIIFRDEVLMKTTNDWENGAYLLVGAGYGLRLSKKTQGLLSLNYSTIRDFAERSSSTIFMMDILW